MELTTGLRAADLRVGADYEGARPERRAQAVELRRRRRVGLGDLLSLVFENAQTLRAAAEESLRAERLEDPESVGAEAARWQPLLPAPGQLAASLYLEVADAARLGALAADLAAIAATVYLEVDARRSPALVATPAAGAADSLPAPAAYLRFELTDSQREAWREGARVILGVAHPRCAATTELSDEQRAAIAQDLDPGRAEGGPR
ncbi:MAG: DUF3501 family protein [Candidatus Dormibacteria bacterium]|jgi:hypothetical protein